MRIFIEQSGYPLANLGDISMLQVAISRLKFLWPNALIKVLTCAPDRLVKFCPQAMPLCPVGRNIWFYSLLGRFSKEMPDPFRDWWLDFEGDLRLFAPALFRGLMELKLRHHQPELLAFKTFIEAVEWADLVVATGGGYITDEFGDFAMGVLGTLGLAKRLGKPAIMLGQGLGPINNVQLFSLARKVLPKLNLIALREQKAGPALLNSLGMPVERVRVTGDDAIELAYEERCLEIGHFIGVNLRRASYAGVSIEMVRIVGQVLQKFADKKDTFLLPIPISEYDSDLVTLEQIFGGGESFFQEVAGLDMPLKVIKQIGRCRVVVTGSYHAGVFALSQGIPVIGLAASRYYLDKFSGLAEQFGMGCEVLLLNDDCLAKKLLESVERLWHFADNFRFPLLEAAEYQIALGKAVYQEVYDLVK